MSESIFNSPLDSTIMSNKSCYPPLIWYTGPIEGDMICNGNCCLSCPYMDNFYPENAIRDTFEIFAIFGIISFFLMVLLSMIFLLLPSQRRNHTARQLLLPLALSVCYFEGSEFFTIQQKNSQCMNEVRRANLDNPMCAVQSFFTLGGAYTIAIYSSLLMTHLHLVSIWKSDFITRNIRIFHALAFVILSIAVILPMAEHKVEATNICFVSVEYAKTYFLPLSFIYVTLLLHVITFIYMTKVSIKANWRDYDRRTTLRLSISEAQQTLTHITHIIRIQWRASFGALLMVTVYSVNWIFYTYKVPFIKDQIGSDWIQQWFQCLANGTQTTCSFYANDHVPSFSWIVTVLFFNRFCGIIIFILFIGKRSMLIELWHYITRKPRPISIHSITSLNEKRRAMIARNSIQKKRMSFSSILSIASSKGLNNTPVSTSLRSSLTAPYPTSILMDSKENYPFKVDKSSKRLTFSSFTSDNNYVIEPVKTRNSYVTIRYSDLLKSVQQNEPVYSEEELGEIIEKYKNYFDREKTSSLQNNATTSNNDYNDYNDYNDNNNNNSTIRYY
ncbi:hypothetical protein F8M41_008216 [Gigaspora margarita]|uniref:G-protein coupled receptors family 2 profile 2 domain-containing protein n=1 Tax=Gigaspora margarita TaxID=4874 RepID=A0A8H3X3S9_GIGMA|nr:hypothetical protein F8M41_008216 [Gigaspora margarita]